MTHPLNAWTADNIDKRNLLKNGKVNALLDKMEADALDNIAETKKALISLYREYMGCTLIYGRAMQPNEAGLSIFRKDTDLSARDIVLSLEAKEKETAFLVDMKNQKDAYDISQSIRKYAPFIEVGGMTIAEAISCEKKGSHV